MFEKIKLYYHNSPKRVGFSLLVVHLTFLAIGILCIQRADMGGAVPFTDSLGLAVLMILFFPLSFPLVMGIGRLPVFASSMIPFVFTVFYYLSFVILVRAAQKTDSILFRFLLGVFISFFVVNTVSGFLFLSSLLSRS